MDRAPPREDAPRHGHGRWEYRRRDGVDWGEDRRSARRADARRRRGTGLPRELADHSVRNAEVALAEREASRAAVRNGPYAWPGGYPTYFLCDDGEGLCHACAIENRRRVIESVATRSNDDWRAVALDINYEDPSLYCAHCNARIESAYAEDEA